MNCGSRRCRTRSSYANHVCSRGAYAEQIILGIAAAVSIILGVSFPPPGEEQAGWIEGVAIIIAILCVTLYVTDHCLFYPLISLSVSSINNWAKERKFRELTEESRKDVQINVVRNGIVAPLSAYQILVGDVIELNTGNGVPGDGLYIFGKPILHRSTRAFLTHMCR